MSNVPKLRFKEFSGEWSTLNVKDIIKDKKGAMKIGPFGSQLKKDTFVESGFKVYGQENIFIKDFSFGDRYITEEHFNKLKTNELYSGDFVISTMGTIGKSTIVPENIERGIMDSHMIRLQLDEINISSIFLGQLFDSFRTFKQAKRLSVGGIMDGLSIGIVNELKFTISPSMQEQEKVASFLTSVDTKIEQLTRKEKLLQQYKKGVMQKIFNQEIRFKADNGSEFEEWEEKKLDDILTTVSTRPYQIKSADVIEDGTYKVIDQGQKAVAGYSNDKDKVYTGGEIIVYGDHTTIVKYIDFEFIVGADGTKLLTTTKSNNLKYMYYNLLHNNIEAEGYKRHFSILRSVLLQIPCLEEQTKIANFLSSIDSKIEQVQQQLNATKEFKKALLQQMFV